VSIATWVEGGRATTGAASEDLDLSDRYICPPISPRVHTRAMPSRSVTPFVILGVLRHGPLSGYGIRAELARSAFSFWSESYGQIYPALHGLRRSGRVRLLPSTREGARAFSGAVRPPRAGGRPKSVYAITSKGRATLEEWLARPPGAEPPRNELLVKLYLADREFLDKPEAWLRALLEKEEELLARLGRMQRDMPRAPHRHPNVRFWSFALAHGEARARATIGWCRSTLAALGHLQQARDRRLAAAARRKLPFE
jgi:PadR family transcriptional regulator, regulatory protein AphA